MFPGTMLDDISSKGKVSIGNDVWIGVRAIILSGVTVGDGTIIGAGNIVVHDVLPYSIVAGNPAKVIGSRFDPDLIDALLILKWWDYPENTIRHNKVFLIVMLL
jgi:acetyltransferase-like isoleucine patch superfamily enzyme